VIPTETKREGRHEQKGVGSAFSLFCGKQLVASEEAKERKPTDCRPETGIRQPKTSPLIALTLCKPGCGL